MPSGGPFSAGGVWTYEPASRIPEILDGTLVAWWILRVPGSDPFVSRIFAVSVVASLWAIAMIVGRRMRTAAAEESTEGRSGQETLAPEASA